MALLKNDLSCVHSELEVNTVDQYQGRDKDVIIYSCTKNNVVKVNSLSIVCYFYINLVFILRMPAY